MGSKASAFVEAGPELTLPVAASVISVQNLVHRYGDRTALNGVSFDVRPAELFGLLGPNGSGKTTLFRILSTLMIPSAGRATIMGCDAAQEPARLRRQIGVVFQAQSIDLKLTAYENLWHQGHLYGLRGADLKQRIDEILSRVGLADRAGELVETFSGGMQRRIELAKGLLHHPGVLLLDEPTTGLDPGARRDLWQYLQILRDEERVSVLVTTHLMEEAERCDRLAIMNEGNLVALGTPEELKAEIGGDIVWMDAAHDASVLAERIRESRRSKMFSFAVPATNSGATTIPGRVCSPVQKLAGGNVLSMVLAVSLVLAVLPLVGVVWTLMNGMITTVDGLFMSLILLTLSGVFALNAYWEMRDMGMIGKKKAAVPASATAATKAPAAKAT